MGRPGPQDENLPEVVPQQPTPSLPEVVPDSSPEAGEQQYYYTEQDKYPAYYDNAPKLPHEQQPLPEYQQQWAGAGDPNSAMRPNSSVPWQSLPGGGDDQTHENEPEKRICGLRKRLFIIIAVVLGLIVVAAAVGGGVGGAMKARDSSSQPELAQTSPAPSSSTPTTTSSAPKPTISLLNQTGNTMDFEFQGWAQLNFSGSHTRIYRELGFFDLEVDVISYHWLPNNTGCCIAFCANKTTQVGFRCDKYIRPQASTRFARVHFFCDPPNGVVEHQCS